MVNLSHAKKAQALASDLEYRTKLHDYTVMADDIKVQQAKKAYSLQSEVRHQVKSLSRLWRRATETEICLMFPAEPLSLRPELDEGSGLGGRRLFEHHPGQKSWRAAE